MLDAQHTTHSKQGNYTPHDNVPLHSVPRNWR